MGVELSKMQSDHARRHGLNCLDSDLGSSRHSPDGISNSSTPPNSNSIQEGGCQMNGSVEGDGSSNDSTPSSFHLIQEPGRQMNRSDESQKGHYHEPESSLSRLMRATNNRWPIQYPIAVPSSSEIQSEANKGMEQYGARRTSNNIHPPIGSMFHDTGAGTAEYGPQFAVAHQHPVSSSDHESVLRHEAQAAYGAPSTQPDIRNSPMISHSGASCTHGNLPSSFFPSNTRGLPSTAVAIRNPACNSQDAPNTTRITGFPSPAETYQAQEGISRMRAIQSQLLCQNPSRDYPSTFRPSNSALKINGVSSIQRNPYLDAILHMPGNSGYLGDPTVAGNQSANISDGENCALWIMGLSRFVTHTDLLAAIRGIGKIYAAVINPPIDTIPTSAAKLVFFERSQAERLMQLAVAGEFIVSGKPIYRVRWNKIKSAPHYYLWESRAIRITGPSKYMNFDFFENFFQSKFTYELDGRGIVPCYALGMASHEWHFGSLRCQAAWAKKAIETELNQFFTVEWAQDPCAAVDRFVPEMVYT